MPILSSPLMGIDTPLPPVELMHRVGRAPAGTDPADHFLEVGRLTRRRLDEVKPDGWSWDGRRVLDFGCGAGRTLRHFLPESDCAHVSGCDIDRRSVAWLKQHLSPPFDVFLVGDEPRLPQPDGHFDAIWGISVFSHVESRWAEWLLELRRVLADDGWLLLTFLNEGLPDLWSEVTGGEPWDADRVGRAVLRADASWNEGGPTVFMSEWWLRSHWGRAFAIERLETRGWLAASEPEAPRTGAAADQGFVVLRKRAGRLTPEDLLRPEPGEPREAVAADAEEKRRRRVREEARRRVWRSPAPLRFVSGWTRRRVISAGRRRG